MSDRLSEAAESGNLMTMSNRATPLQQQPQQQPQSGNILTTAQRHLGQRVVSFSPKKCFVCLAVFEFNDQEYQAIRHSYMDIKVFNLLPVNERNKTMRLIVLMNKFVMSICKCKKKLAHLDCFNNYVDVKQGGNINIAIMCTQCNFEYEFDYSYNTPSLQIFDYVDYLSEMGSSLMTISLCAASTYWCSFSYSILTLVQIYGLEEGMQRLRGLNKLALFGLLPLVPMALVSARFIPWHDYFINLFPKYFNNWNESSKLLESSSAGHLTGNSSSSYSNNNHYSPPRSNQENHMNDDENDDESRSCDQFLVMIRRIVGGLFVPTAAICVDRLILSKLNLSQSVLVRTTVAGIAFVTIKGAIKFTLLQRKISQQNCRDILDYVH